jgi:2-dehydro-3-deoxyphosphogluconate aldolase/(4S)-4-hydroxy-2-oxoglutarate aldolase
MPTGGVNTSKENLKSWFDAGVTCVGLGSQLISNQVIEQRDFEGLKVTVSQVLQTIQSLK